MRQLALDVSLQRPPTLDNFCPGPNGQAHQYLIETVARGSSTVPTYLWGENASGKTHLLQATATALQAQGAAVGYLYPDTPAEEFNPAWSAIFLDNVERYTAEQQQLAFNWFVNAHSHTCWVVAAGTLPPADLPLREDLRTRQGWGHVFALHALNDEERQAVMQQAASSLGLSLSDEVIAFMLHRFARDLGSLMGLLERLDHYALSRQRAITIPLLKDMLKDTE